MHKTENCAVSLHGTVDSMFAQKVISLHIVGSLMFIAQQAAKQPKQLFDSQLLDMVYAFNCLDCSNFVNYSVLKALSSVSLC